MNQGEADKLDEMLDSTAARLCEHFEAVQILACDTGSEGTRFFKKGMGNWFARLEMCRQFTSDDARIEQADKIAQKIKPPDEDWR